MVNYNTSVCDTFAALGDPVRLRVIARLSRGEATVSRLASEHDISLPAFLKHLRSLEQAGLITTRKVGRTRTCRLRVASLARTEDWLARHRRFWEAQLDSLQRYLIATEEQKEKSP